MAYGRKPKAYGWEDNRSVILCALGVKPTGEQRMLGFLLARHEDKVNSEHLFDNTFQSEESANRYANTIISYLNQDYPLNDKLHINN